MYDTWSAHMSGITTWAKTRVVIFFWEMVLTNPWSEQCDNFLSTCVNLCLYQLYDGMSFRTRRAFNLNRKENIGLDKTKKKRTKIKEKIRKYLHFSRYSTKMWTVDIVFGKRCPCCFHQVNGLSSCMMGLVCVTCCRYCRTSRVRKEDVRARDICVFHCTHRI